MIKSAIYLFLAMFTSFLWGCSATDDYIPPDYVIMAERTGDEVAQVLSKRHKMKLVGEGGGMMGTVNSLILVFQIQGIQTKEHLRQILVDSTEELLQAINDTRELRPHLKVYPFTNHEIAIEIFIVDEHGYEPFDPDVSIAAAGHGKIEYKTVDRENPYAYKSQVEESYEAAIKIVEMERKNN